MVKAVVTKKHVCTLQILNSKKHPELNGTVCNKTYETEEQLKSHQQANHWKQLKV